MVQAATKSCDELRLRVVAGVDLGQRAQLRVRAEDEIDAGAGPLAPRRSCGRGPRTVAASSDVGFHSVPMSSRLTKKSLVSVPGRVGEHAVLRAAGVRAEHAQAADQHRHLRRGQREQLRPVDEQLLGRHARSRPSGSCGSRRRSARAPRRTATSVCSCVASVRPGVNGTSTSWPAFFAACSTAAAAAEHDQVGERDLLAAGLRGVEVAWMPSSVVSTFASFAGWFTSQSFCGASRMRAPLAPPRLSEPRKVEAEAQAVDDELRDRQARGEDLRLQRRDVGGVDQRVIDGRDRVLPDQLLRRAPPGRGSGRAGPCRGGSA